MRYPKLAVEIRLEVRRRSDRTGPRRQKVGSKVVKNRTIRGGIQEVKKPIKGASRGIRFRRPETPRGQKNRRADPKNGRFSGTRDPGDQGLKNHVKAVGERSKQRLDPGSFREITARRKHHERDRGESVNKPTRKQPTSGGSGPLQKTMEAKKGPGKVKPKNPSRTRKMGSGHTGSRKYREAELNCGSSSPDMVFLGI